MVSAGSYHSLCGMVAGVDRLLEESGDTGIAHGRKAQASPRLGRERVHHSTKDLTFVYEVPYRSQRVWVSPRLHPNPRTRLSSSGAPKPC